MTKEKTKTEAVIAAPVESGNPEGFDSAAYEKGTQEVMVIVDQLKGTTAVFAVTNN